MTQEQKAKAYDKAIQRAKEILEIGVKESRDIKFILSFFPELKESKEERIRKAAIAFVEASDHFDYHLGISKEDVIAWLEKQKQ